MKTIFLSLMLLITVSVSGQVNDKKPSYISAGPGLGNIVQGAINFTHGGTGLQAHFSYNRPFSAARRPILLVAAGGIQIPITKFDEHNYHVTPLLGYAQQRTGTQDNLFKKDVLFTGLEVCKYFGDGSVYLHTNYTTTLYGVIGIRYVFDL